MPSTTLEDKKPSTPARDPLAGVPATDKPDEKFIAAWFRRQWDRWRARRDLDQVINDLVYKETKVKPEGPNGEGGELLSEVVRSGLAKTILREMVGVVASEPPRIEALADGIGPDKQRSASQIEEFDSAWYEDTGGDDLQSLADEDAAAYGRGVTHVVWARQYWVGMPAQDNDEDRDKYLGRLDDWRRVAPNPVLRTHCPAPQTMFDEDEWTRLFGVPRAVYWYHRPLSEIAEQYPKSKAASRYRKSKARNEDPMQLFVSFANRRWQTYAICDTIAVSDPTVSEGMGAVSVITDEPKSWEVLASFEHGCLRNPFEVYFGDVSSDPKLVNRYAGFFDNCHDLIQHIDNALSQYATSVRRNARSQFVLLHNWGPNGQMPGGVNPDTLTPREVEMNTDKVLSLAPGEQLIEISKDVSQHKAAIEYLNLLTSFVQGDTMDPSKLGNMSSSGYQFLAMLQTMERKLKRLIGRKTRSIENQLAAVHALVVYICDAGDLDDVSIWRATDEESDGGTLVAVGGWVSLKPDQARKARIRVKLVPRLDTADAASAQIAIQLAQAVSQGWLDIDKDWILSRWLGLENPERHRRSAMLQRYLMEPDIKAWLMREALKDADMLMQSQDVQEAGALNALEPKDLMLAPAALRAALAQRGLLADGSQGQLPALPPGADAAAAGVMDPGLAGVLGQAAPGSPVAGTPATQGPAAAMAGPAGGLNLALGLQNFGQPASPAQGAV